ncbi:MAG: hypothetical protein BGO29_11870 [Bacteroidales bacterium 36-12]|mgnify:CR=1 FL=1|nr:MAG: hypothetical protein BGO29_11870 [Bacteroidales bacterium 36-12]
MKHFTFLKTMLIAAVILIGSANVLAVTIEKTFDSFGWTNAYAPASGDLDANISFTADKGGASNAPAYYTDGTALRLYSVRASGNGNILTINASNGAVITEIVLTKSGDQDPSSVTYSVDGGTAAEITRTTTEYSVSGINASSSVLITNAHTGGDKNLQMRVSAIKVIYTLGAAPTVSAPTFSPAGGTYTEAQTVTISSITTGASIYYTTDGSTPTASSTPYTVPFTVSTTTTVKAIAILDEETSAVATATYTFPTVVADIAAFLALSKDDKAVITGAITVVYQNGQNLYIKDGSGSLLVFGNIGKTFSNGDQLVGLEGVKGEYGQAPQMTSPVAPDKVSGTAVNPTVLDLNLVSTTDLAKYVKITRVQFKSDVEYSTTSTVNGTLANPDGFIVRDNFRLGGSYIANVNYDIIGFVAYYNGSSQLYPVSITLSVDASPTIIIEEVLLDFECKSDETQNKTIEVTAENLTEDIVVQITGDDAAKFTYELDSEFDRSGGAVLITYTPIEEGIHTAKLEILSEGADTKEIMLNGKANPATGIESLALNSNIWSTDSKIMFNATAGELIEIYNITGQKIISQITVEGLNTIPVTNKGVLLVKVGDRITKIVK